MCGRTELGFLVYELTEACNQNCLFCYNHWRPAGCNPVDTRLARHTLRKILSQAKIGSISFSGGEPSLLGNLHDLVLKCRFAGSNVNVLTNGTLLTEADIRNFASLGIGTIQIPLLSHNCSVHDSLTRLPQSWEKARASLELALGILGADHVAAVLIVTARNASDLDPTLDLYRELGLRTIMVNRFNIGGNGIANRRELELAPDQLRTAFRCISDFSVRHPGMSFASGVCTPMCLMNPDDYPGIKFTSCTTDLRQRPLAISASGDVRFCNHSPFVLGNIYQRPLREILEDESLIARYTGVPQECSACHLYPRCKGGCRAASEQLYGSFSRIDPIAETLLAK
ncbi:MAG: radical SAM protein [Bacteroidales bacterium]|nr:radical SAM protein [Bacteroidales bacterium]